MRVVLKNILQRLAVISLVCSIVAATADVVQTDNYGTILQLGGQPYYATFHPLMTIHPSNRAGVKPGFVPITSIRAQFSPITKAYLESHMAMYKDVDDVWNKYFTEGMAITYDGQATGFFEEAAEEWLDSLNLSHLYLSTNIRLPTFKTFSVFQVPTGPPAGPYFTVPSVSSSGLDIHNVYRLQKDIYESFLFGVLPRPSGGWMQTNITLETDPGTQYLPIPSRISLMTKSLPLSGTRFALKDIFDAQGLPTGAGSLAYARVHSPPHTTAPSIRRLLDLGATLIGKTRTSQFAHGAFPWEFHEIPYSWNPRGDGFLTASASSSGSACAIAGYDWIEFSIGSDTRGSVKKPAAMVGVYGMRPTHGSLDLTGVVPLSEEMDTAGFFSRDPRLFAEIGRLWYEKSPVKIKRQAIRFPKTLLYPTEHFPVSNPDAQALYDSFIESLQTHLKITKTPINFTETLQTHIPDGSFAQFHSASNTLAEYRSWISVGKPLTEAHMERFGTPPTFDPRPDAVFARARNISLESFESAVEIRKTFREGVMKEVIKSDIKSCSESLFVYDTGTGGRPSYRVEDFNHLDGATQALLTAPLQLPSNTSSETKPSDFFSYLSPMAGLPEITIPLGQVGYYSQVNREWEMLPVAVQLVAHPGCDDMLLELVKKLAIAGVVKPVKVGKEAF